ncbi:MAG: DUF2793 domain-containing protein [Pseudomonadota bacterium]
MSDETENLKLPYIMPNQAQKHVTHNEAIRILDGLVHLSVVSGAELSPPESPQPGARYIVGAGATGDWLGWDASVAFFADGFWIRLAPEIGWQAWVQDAGEMWVWSGTAWIPANASSQGGAIIQNAALFGVGTTAGETTPFAAKLNSALWTALPESENGDGQLRITLNKEGAAQDAGLVFQTGYASRALLGLIGSDDFSVKVSANGTQFSDALTIGHDTGNVAIGTSADANNRLVVSGENTLFTHSAGLNVVMNKGADGDDLSFALQSNYATQALLGLLGGRDFTIKVGSDYKTALVIDNASGSVQQPLNPSFSATAPDDQEIAADTWVAAVFDNVRHNVGAHYDPATGLFTAPVDGCYVFGASVLYKQGSGSPDQMLLGLSIDGDNPANDRKSRSDSSLSNQKTSISLTSCIALQKSQTVQAFVRFSNGDALVSGYNTNHFWGSLVG